MSNVGKTFKGMAVTNGFSLLMTVMNYMTNKYEHPDDMNRTTDEEKAVVKAMKKNSLDIA